MARFRVTFGTGGIVCFGSRTAVVANLGSIDLHCRPMEDATPPARIEAALGVGAHGGPLEYDSLVRYQEAAAAFSEVVQPPLAEFHTWKLIATLLGHKPVDTKAVTTTQAGHKMEADAQHAEREWEALRAWMRLALWDGSALDCASTGADAILPAQLDRVWSLFSSLHTADGVATALADSGDQRAYLAAVFAQPVTCVRSDIARQRHSWMAGNILAPLPQRVESVYRLLSGLDVELTHDGCYERREGSWLQAEARKTCAGAPLSPLGGFAALDESATPPNETQWHVLQLLTGSQTHLHPLPLFSNCDRSRTSWVRFGDYSFAFHLMVILCLVPMIFS